MHTVSPVSFIIILVFLKNLFQEFVESRLISNEQLDLRKLAQVEQYKQISE